MTSERCDLLRLILTTSQVRLNSTC